MFPDPKHLFTCTAQMQGFYLKPPLLATLCLSIDLFGQLMPTWDVTPLKVDAMFLLHSCKHDYSCGDLNQFRRNTGARAFRMMTLLHFIHSRQHCRSITGHVVIESACVSVKLLSMCRRAVTLNVQRFPSNKLLHIFQLQLVSASLCQITHLFAHFYASAGGRNMCSTWFHGK